MKKPLRKIVVLFNAPVGNDEDDVDTQKSALEVVKGLLQAGYQSEVLGITKDNIARVKSISADLVFNLVEWAGLDYVLGVEVIKTLEKVGLPYTGSNAWGYEVSCNKVLMKELLVKNNIPTPKYVVVSQGFSPSQLTDFKFPVIIKPSQEHSAIGVSQASVCADAMGAMKQAEKLVNQYKQSALIEEFIDGDEAQVTVLEKNGSPWVLPPAVFRYQKKTGYWPINTYEAKWAMDHWEAKMSQWVEDEVLTETTSVMEDLATKCYLHLGGRSYPRIDMRLGGDHVVVLEVNNNPGIGFDSELGIAVSAQKVGLDWQGLLRNIVQEAYDTSNF